MSSWWVQCSSCPYARNGAVLLQQPLGPSGVAGRVLAA